MPTKSRPLIHLVNPLWDSCGGADRRTVQMFHDLSPHADVRLWSEYEPAAAYADLPVRRIRPWLLQYPRHGTLVFIGVYFRIGHWSRLASPERQVVLYNTDQPDRLDKALRRLAHAGHSTDIIHTSRALRTLSGYPGQVLESPIDVAPFLAIDRSAAQASRPFTVGRLSRDTLKKHHADDIALYRRLARQGLRVRIMGGTCLAPELGGEPGIELLPAGAADNASFLASLDAFIYRTSDNWYETYGRVVFEAMASGLPVVCGRRGGFADYIDHGVNGLLFDDSSEAERLLLALMRDRQSGAALGNAARRYASRFFQQELPGRMLAALLPRNGSNDQYDTVRRFDGLPQR